MMSSSYIDAISLIATSKYQKIQKCDLKQLIFESLYLPNDLIKFNKTFMKNVPYDNIKSHKKAWLYPLFRK